MESHFILLEQQHPSDSPRPLKVIPGHPVLLDCPKCHHFISSNEIDLEHGTAECTSCGHTFDYGKKLRSDPHRRPEMIMPESVEALKLTSMLEIVVDWYKSAPKRTVLTLVSGAFFWNLLIIPFAIFLAYHGSFLWLAFFAGHLMTGLYLVKQLLATFLNKSKITVDSSGIEISHSPIRTTLNKVRKIARRDIEQLFVVRYTQKFGRKDQRGVQAYALFVIMKNGDRIELLRGMDRSSQLYLEQEIEKYLGIKDTFVKGEIERTEG